MKWTSLLTVIFSITQHANCNSFWINCSDSTISSSSVWQCGWNSKGRWYRDHGSVSTWERWPPESLGQWRTADQYIPFLTPHWHWVLAVWSQCFILLLLGFWFSVCCSVLLISWLAELWVVPTNTSSIISELDTYKNWRTCWTTSQLPHTVQPSRIWATVYCPDKVFLCLPRRMVPLASTPKIIFPHYEITCPCGLPSHYPELFIYPDHRTPNFIHRSPVDSTSKNDL